MAKSSPKLLKKLPKPLTPKQEKFANKYLECSNASEAYRYAYSCGKATAKTIHETASKLLCNPNVAARVQELTNELKAKSNITKERILDEYASIAFSSIAHYHKKWIERKELDELTLEQKTSIKTIQTQTRQMLIDGAPMVVEFVKIELYDKLKALDSIVKMLGFDAPAKHEITGKDGEDIKMAPIRIEIVNVSKKDNGNNSND